MGGQAPSVASYLLIANQTAESPELLHATAEIHAHDPDAEFVIVVPATPLNLRPPWRRNCRPQSVDRLR